MLFVEYAWVKEEHVSGKRLARNNREPISIIDIREPDAR